MTIETDQVALSSKAETDRAILLDQAAARIPAPVIFTARVFEAGPGGVPVSASAPGGALPRGAHVMDEL